VLCLTPLAAVAHWVVFVDRIRLRPGGLLGLAAVLFLVVGAAVFWAAVIWIMWWF
jgi:hypothetical protein